jgi:hypothetical protein
MAPSKSPRKRSRNKTPAPVAVREDEDLRSAPPVRRLVGQLLGLKAKVEDRGKVFAGWRASIPNDSEVYDVIGRGGLAFSTCLDSFDAIFGVLAALEAQGFSPPRKYYTSTTSVGDRVAILEAHRGTYADLVTVPQMSDLRVVKRYPGKGAGRSGGGLAVESLGGQRLKVAASHVVRLTS